MPFAYKVNRITFHGTSFQGQEEWSTGFYMGYPDQDASAPTVGDLASLAANWQTWFTASASKVNGGWKTDGVKSALLNVDGSTSLDDVVYYNYPTAISGGYSGGNNPPQIALVVTLKSDIPRGLGANGRMFLPGISQGIQDNGKIIDVARDEMADQLQDFFDAANTTWNTGQLINASKGRTVAPTAPGVNAPITSIKLGNVYDTQRRRRNQLAEQYASRVVTAGF